MSKTLKEKILDSLHAAYSVRNDFSSRIMEVSHVLITDKKTDSTDSKLAPFIKIDPEHTVVGHVLKDMDAFELNPHVRFMTFAIGYGQASKLNLDNPGTFQSLLSIVENNLPQGYFYRIANGALEDLEDYAAYKITFELRRKVDFRKNN